MTAMPTQECMESVILCLLFMFSLCELLYDDVPYIDIQNDVRAAPRVHFVQYVQYVREISSLRSSFMRLFGIFIS